MKSKRYKSGMPTGGNRKGSTSAMSGYSKAHGATDTSPMAGKSTSSKASPYVGKKGKANIAQGGEKESAGLSRGRSRTNRGKNHLTQGPQGFRG
ncbi:MAG: hypothetical protein GY722_14125 [bacterium]|nr:hypothetical protein [bacterium]